MTGNDVANPSEELRGGGARPRSLTEALGLLRPAERDTATWAAWEMVVEALRPPTRLRPTSRSAAIREVLIAALRAADQPLSTDELRAVPPDSLVPHRAGNDVYLQLRALERAGMCRCIRRPGWRAVFWEAVSPAMFEEDLPAVAAEQWCSPDALVLVDLDQQTTAAGDAAP